MDECENKIEETSINKDLEKGDDETLSNIDKKIYIEEKSTEVKEEINLNQIIEKSEGKEDNDGNLNYDPKHVTYEGDVAIYTDPSSHYQYKWDKEKSEWVPHTSVTYSFEDDTHTYTDSDGVKYFWDTKKNAWFPKINDDFMAQYQMNYGFIDNTNVEVKKKETKPPLQLPKKPVEVGVKRKPSEPTWFDVDQKQNTKVYVSNLPLDITEDEFVDIMQKCGIIMREPKNGKMKIKLYTEPGNNQLKGDALCTYIRIESVELALKLLDGYDIRGKKLKVEQAKFEMKGTYDPKLKPKSKKRKEKDKLRKMQEKLFDWRPEKKIGERAKHERTVIVKNVFESKMFDEDVGLILELQEDLREECSKCGVVKKVIIYDRHPEGVAQINMIDPESADACITLLNGRWFGKRQLTAEIWDGKTKFKIAETDSQISQRLEKWDNFLEGEQAEKTENKAIVN